MIEAVLLGSLVGGDRTAFGQTLLAHPLIAACLAGLLAGLPREGLWLGIALSLLSATRIPVGEGRIRDWASAAVAVPFCVPPASEGFVWGLALLWAFLCAWWGGAVIEFVRTVAQRRILALQPRIDAGDLRSMERVHLGLTALHFFRGALVVGTSVLLGRWLLARLVPQVPALERTLLVELWRVAPLAGLPVLLRFHLPLAPRRWLVAGAVIGLAIHLLLAPGGAPL